MSKQIELHVLQFYQPKKLLGSGAYGHVWKVIDKQSKQVFALKKIFDAFQNSTDAQRTYRQISLLHQMQHKNIVKLHKVIKSKNKKDLYLVFQYMQSDLHSLVGQSILSPTHITFIVYQIVKSLKYIHSAQLIHRDLKPSNILINSQCEIKLCDFGLARSLAHQQNQQNILSQQVATRWYRSPEMLLSSTDYSKPTDIWSVGCIVAQLIIGQPIFQGDSTLNQLQKIIQFTGIPSKYTIDSLKSQVAQSIINNLSVRKKSTKQYFKNLADQNTELINLTIKMLDFNPNKRPTVEQLLKNSIFKQFELDNAEEQQTCQKFIVPQIDDNTKLTLQEYRKIIYKDIERRYPQFNDAARMKSFYSVQKLQKNKSLIENDRKKSVQNQHHSSFHHNSKVNKLLPKTCQNTPTVSKNKKSINKKQILKHVNHNSQNNTLQFLKYKFSKIEKPMKNEQMKQKQTKQLAKMQHNTKKQQNLQNKAYQNTANNQKIKKGKKTQKEFKQNKQVALKYTSPQRQKGTIHRIQQKATIYKQQLKRIKSSKNLIKTKIAKPKFDKTLTRVKQIC